MAAFGTVNHCYKNVTKSLNYSNMSNKFLVKGQRRFFNMFF